MPHLWQLLTGSSRKPGFGVKFARNSAGAMGTRTDGRLRQDDEQPCSAGVLITLCALQVCSLHCVLCRYAERDIIWLNDHMRAK